MTHPEKESPMQRLVRFLKGEVPPENPALSAALKRASRKVAKKRLAKREPVPGTTSVLAFTCRPVASRSCSVRSAICLAGRNTSHACASVPAPQ